MQEMPDSVLNAFGALPQDQADTLMSARAQILTEAARLKVGPLTETLKWGQPAYLTEATKSGTTIRLGLHGGAAALFVHCQTTIIKDARTVFEDAADFVDNRAVILGGAPGALTHVICAALTYHRRGA